MANRDRDGSSVPHSCISFETIYKSNKKAQMGRAAIWAKWVSREALQVLVCIPWIKKSK